MHATETSPATRMKVGLFTVLGLLLVGFTTVWVNHKPFWWRPCKLVKINVDDATGLKTKSPVRSLGLDIGYLNSIVLSETHVELGICITEKVEVLPETRAYIRGEGFLGDKFVELKPVKYVGPLPPEDRNEGKQSALGRFYAEFLTLERTAAAEDEPKKAPEIPVGEGSSQDMTKLVNKVDSLVNEMTKLTNNLKGAINPEELRSTMKQLNRTLENASRTLAPEGGLTQTAQRTLAKLEDAIEQLRDQLTRVNQGEGSVGSLLNDPYYAEQVRLLLKNANHLLSRMSGVRFNVDVGGELIQGYTSGRGWFMLRIWPTNNRYYRLGVTIDPRGKLTSLTTVTTVGNTTQTTYTSQQEATGMIFTAMLGKVFFDNRLDLSLGVLFGDGAGSIIYNYGPRGREDQFQIRGDLYSRSGSPIDGRFTATVRPFLTTYVEVGLESVRIVNNSIPLFLGAGLAFDDDDIKLLFAFR